MSGATGFFDNMEAGSVSTNWVVSGGWNYSTATMAGTGAFSGTRSLAESPAAGANYGNDVSLAARINRTFNFSGIGAGYMTFWLKHRSVNGDDYLRVQYSTNNGSSWFTLPGRKTIAENRGNIGGVPSYTGLQDVWVREVISLAPVVGASSVQLRFLFVSDAAGTNDGFFIDDVAVVTSSASTSLNTRILNFSGRIEQQQSQLFWDAATDAAHDYFELQRSADGANFETIGKIAGSGNNFNFTDRSPLAGNNYYRLRQVNQSGSFHYSGVVLLRHAGAVAVSLFPTVTDGAFTLQLQTAAAATFQIDFIDQFGRMVMQRVVQAPEGNHQQNFSVASLAKGVYYVRVRRSTGEFVSTERLIKQ